MTSMSERESSDKAVGTAETHISWVFLTPDRAFKLLKPVQMPFLDHTEAADRVAAATREFELNHRIAPDVYLATSDIVENGEVTDRMIVMRRLPASRRLSALAGAHDFRRRLRATARGVAALHAGREPVYDAPMTTVEGVRQNWQDNFEAMRPHIGSLIDESDSARVEALVDTYLYGRDTLFEQRIADGFIRDVHGDLIADDVFCLDDGPRIIDCLAFNDGWRIIDVLSDIGFLIMDIHRLAGTEAAEQLMTWYQEFSNEHHPPSLAHHYVAYRAHVRAKIACLRFDQGDVASREAARRYHDLACHHLERARLRMILVGGGPGVGKSTLAADLGANYGFPVLATDEIRKDLTAKPRGEHQFAAPDEGIYDAATKDRAYTEQIHEAELLIQAGNGVVLDASWSSSSHRVAARRLAARCGTELIEIECVVDPAIARERIARRLSNPHNPSDATPDLVDAMAERRDPWPEATTISCLPPPRQVLAEAVETITRMHSEPSPTRERH